MITLISPANNSELSILTSIQKEFIRRERPIKADTDKPESEKNAYPWLSEELRSSRDLTHPASVIFKWKNSDLLAENIFELSTSEDFSVKEGRGTIATLSEVYVSADEPDVFCVRADNLLSGTRYYWRITSGDESVTASFSTVRGEIRFIRAGCVQNVRDTGGRVNKNGKAIRQGLIFRGAEPDVLLSPDNLGAPGFKIMLCDLAVKSDVDLRYESHSYTESPLGKDVSFNYFPLYAYGGTLNDEGRAMVRRILEFMADESNYPIFYHCVQGADRTGTIGMYLDAILDMSDEDIMLNYNITSLANDSTRSWYTTRDNVGFFEYLDEVYPTLSVKEKLMTNIRLSGISEEIFQKIRDNLLE